VKTLLALILLSCAAFCQSDADAAIAKTKAACGPDNIWFDAKVSDEAPSPASPAPGKALVYVLGQDLTADVCDECGIIARVGLDGDWTSALRGTSYVAFAVDPGERHLCVNWQSRMSGRSKVAALANFTAEPGKIYYFKMRFFVAVNNSGIMDLDQTNDDEGRYLLASSQPSEFHALKPRKPQTDGPE
jgi:hypothetical protein